MLGAAGPHQRARRERVGADRVELGHLGAADGALGLALGLEARAQPVELLLEAVFVALQLRLALQAGGQPRAEHEQR